MHCKAILIKLDKQLMNRLMSIVLEYEARGFNVTTTFTEGCFESIFSWTNEELLIDLTNFATDS